MYRLHNGKGEFVGQWDAKSAFQTALDASLSDHKGWKKANERDANNYDIVGKDGKTLFSVMGPREERADESGDGEQRNASNFEA